MFQKINLQETVLYRVFCFWLFSACVLTLFSINRQSECQIIFLKPAAPDFILSELFLSVFKKPLSSIKKRIFPLFPYTQTGADLTQFRKIHINSQRVGIPVYGAAPVVGILSYLPLTGDSQRNYRFLPQHFLYFLPLPQGQGSLRPILGGFTTVEEVLCSLYSSFLLSSVSSASHWGRL